MRFPTPQTPSELVRVSARALATVLFATVFVLGSVSPVLAADASVDSDSDSETDQEAPAPADAPAADEAPADGGDTTTTTTTTTTTVTATTGDESAEEEEDEGLPITASLGISTSIGLGTFVGGSQNQDMVSMGFTPSITYSLGDGMSLKAAIGGTLYALNDYSTPLANGQFLFSDMYFQFGHGSIYSNEDIGLTINGNFRVYLPTSLGSQFQNRVMTIRPSIGMSWKFGPVSLSSSVNVAKYFMTSTNASIDCDAFKDSEQCREGRDDVVGGSAAAAIGPVHGGFASEQNGGDVFLPGGGVNSFYVGWNFGASWTIVENLNLGFSLTGIHYYSVRSYDISSTSSPNAKPGRSQIDRLISSLSLSYQIHKHVGVGIDFGTDTLRPFGADGNDLVILDTERAPDNISSVGFSVTGTL